MAVDDQIRIMTSFAGIQKLSKNLVRTELLKGAVRGILECVWLFFCALIKHNLLG